MTRSAFTIISSMRAAIRCFSSSCRAKLWHRFGREIPIVELFERPTIANMAEALRGPDVDDPPIAEQGEFAQSGTSFAA